MSAKRSASVDARASQTEFYRRMESGRIASLYLLEGEEAYLRDEALKRLIKAAVDESVRDFNVTTIAVGQGNLDEAKQYFRECISLAKELRRFRKINILILTVNYISFPQEKVIASILGAIDQSQRENQRPINPLRKHYYDQVMTRALNRLGEVRFQSAFAKGQKMSLDQALDLAWKTIDELSN